MNAGGLYGASNPGRILKREPVSTTRFDLNGQAIVRPAEILAPEILSERGNGGGVGVFAGFDWKTASESLVV